MKVRTILVLDGELLRQAAAELGTTGTPDTVHAALWDVVARSRRRWLAERDYSELDAMQTETRKAR